MAPASMQAYAALSMRIAGEASQISYLALHQHDAGAD